MKKIIDRIVQSPGAPGAHDLWLTDKNELKVYDNEEWKTVGGNSGGGGGDDTPPVEMGLGNAIMKAFMGLKTASFPISPCMFVKGGLLYDQKIDSVYVDFINDYANTWTLENEAGAYAIDDVPDDLYESLENYDIIAGFLYDLEEVNKKASEIITDQTFNAFTVYNQMQLDNGLPYIKSVYCQLNKTFVDVVKVGEKNYVAFRYVE